uniref:Uncharacterized protein n=1 Tax=Klebsiella pneumoniae TaxID=573 RepID=A0A345WYM9_KLEPN|nr:hypothetical protein [Klebsiella pneumoniae]
MQCRAIRKQCAVPQNGNAVASIRGNHNYRNCGQPYETRQYT